MSEKSFLFFSLKWSTSNSFIFLSKYLNNQMSPAAPNSVHKSMYFSNSIGINFLELLVAQTIGILGPYSLK